MLGNKILFIANSIEGTLHQRVLMPCKYLNADYAETINVLSMQCIVNNEIKDMSMYDLICLQFAWDNDLLWLIKKLNRLNIKTVIDLDDLYLDGGNKYYPIDYSNGSLPVLIKSMEACSLITVTTPYLAEVYGKYNKTIVLENCIDINEFNIKHNEYSGTVGWYSSGIRYAEFNDIMSGWIPEDVKLYMAGSYIFNNFKHNNKIVVDRWLPVDTPKIVANIDIGLIPLSLCKFNDGKSDLKGLEMGIMSIPTLCSPTEPYRALISHGSNGFLIHKRSDWTKYLNLLLNDNDLRITMGNNARKVSESRDIKTNINKWMEAYDV